VLKGFKQFLLRGNVVELAVAVVIGTAFTALVASFGKAFIDPLLKVAMGGGVSGGKIVLDRNEKGEAVNVLDFGLFINAGLTFVITAAIVYFIFVVPIRKLTERQKRGEPVKAPPAPAEDVVLLREIRDLLKGEPAGGSKTV
jgi:large conductance mechanosensitive channel